MNPRNPAWKLAGNLIGGGAYFAFTLLLARLLGPEGYGQYTFALGWAGLFALLPDFALNPVLSRDLARRPEMGRAYTARVLTTKALLASMAAALLVAATAAHTPARRLAPMVGAAFLFLLATSLAETGQALAAAYERFPAGAGLNLAQKGLVSVAGLAAATSGLGPSDVLWTVTGAGAAGLALTTVYWHRSLRTRVAPYAQSATDLARAAFPLFLQTVFISIYSRIGTILLGTLKGDAQTGLYGAAYRFVEASHVLPAAFVAATTARLARADGGEWSLLVRRSLAGMLVMAVAVAGGLAAVAGLVPRFVYTEEYAAVTGLLRTLALSIPFLYVNYALNLMLTVRGRAPANAWISGAAVAFSLAANLWAIPRWGARGAALTCVLTEAFITVLSALALARKRTP